MKPVLMIHEVEEWMFCLPLHKYTLTFDDGLYSQYIHFPKIKQINTEKIFFISTGIVASNDTLQSESNIRCDIAHQHYFNTGSLKYYMNWSQINEISMDSQCEIGAHSHMHIRYTGFNTIHDIKLMMRHFEQNNITPTSFCFPYNDENVVYRCLLKQYGFDKFYGKDRIDINRLKCEL